MFGRVMQLTEATMTAAGFSAPPDERLDKKDNRGRGKQGVEAPRIF